MVISNAYNLHEVNKMSLRISNASLNGLGETQITGRENKQ